MVRGEGGSRERGKGRGESSERRGEVVRGGEGKREGKW